VLWQEGNIQHLTMKKPLRQAVYEQVTVFSLQACLQVQLEKRMAAFIDKAIIVLKALITLLELIRAFF